MCFVVTSFGFIHFGAFRLLEPECTILSQIWEVWGHSFFSLLEHLLSSYSSQFDKNSVSALNFFHCKVPFHFASMTI